ncbi:MAG: 3-isopropylmalate dehydratase small subunit [Thermodesulfobacteriota bacterium]|nr:3-isopropylmalate dehydratase small subunit [Thermodesulfobacteriota bacterium]
MEYRGKAWKFGSNIDTDAIIPGIYLYTTDPQILGRHCMEVVAPGFTEKVQPGDILVAEDNFGCGSSREHAPVALKAVGLSCVIARSFARIFFRNSINIGLPVIECEEAPDKIENSDELVVYPEKGKIVNLTRKEEYRSTIYPEFFRSIILKGGLLNSIK